MKKFLSTALSIVVWCALAGYFVVAARHCREARSGEVLGAVGIEIVDSALRHVVSPAAVRGWLDEAGIPLEGSPVEEVDTERVRRTIAAQPFVRTVGVYTEQSGVLHVRVGQREPRIRFDTRGGHSFYVSDDDWVMPTTASAAQYLPVVTGDVDMPFAAGYHGSLGTSFEEGEKKSEKNYLFLCKLINFVRLVESDPFWSAAIVQINVVRNGGAEWKEPELELIPRVGDHVVLFGTPDDARAKLDRLGLFYRNVLDREGWDTYRSISLKYRDQVVCRK